MTDSRRKPAVDAWKLLDDPENVGTTDELVTRLRVLADQDNVSAVNVLAMLYNDGLRDQDGKLILKADARLARRYESRGATLGDPGSMTALADRITKRAAGRGQLQLALRLYHQAFARGYETAAYNVACLHQNRGEYRQAVRWYRKALDAGETSALLPIARAELYGIGTSRNTTAALKKLRQLAKTRDKYYPGHWLQTEALLVMADVLISGWPVPRNRAEGLRLLRRAAELGSQPAIALMAYYS